MSTRILRFLSRAIHKSETEVKRWIVWNIVIEPVTALLYIPYNIFVIGYSTPQFLRWALTGAEYGLAVNFIIQVAATHVVRFMDKHIPESE